MWIPQTRIFYAELLPVVHGCCVALGARPAAIADIGAGSGAGSALVAEAMNGILGWPAELHAFDIEPQFATYAARTFPHIHYRVENVLHCARNFDVAILSHTLEHMDGPEAFVARLAGVARLSLIYVPFEVAELIPGHVARFTADRIRAMPGFTWGRTGRSLGWQAGVDPRVAMFVCASEDARRYDLAALSRRLDGLFVGESITPELPAPAPVEADPPPQEPEAVVRVDATPGVARSVLDSSDQPSGLFRWGPRRGKAG
jgi:hypothetical protein